MSDPDRYHRQMLLPQIGAAGQQRLREAHALIVGCGALGSVLVDLLARAGIGRLTIVDRDLVELTNLSRQVLFDERDVEQGMPKAEAARARVAAINRDVQVHAHVDDFSPRNAERYIAGVDLILDGLDNFQTRYVLNDLAVKHGLPYVYGGAVGTTGMTMTILPHAAKRQAKGGCVQWSAAQSTPCLRCVFPEAPPPGTSPTCDTAGVLATAVSTIAAQQVTSAIKLIVGDIDSLDRRLISIDVWSNASHAFDVGAARDGGQCPCCVQGHFEFLEGVAGGATTSLCGRNAVQVTPPPDSTLAALDLATVARRLAPHGRFISNRFLLRGVLDGVRADRGELIELTLFPDGRAIIKGTNEPQVARGIYDKYVGS